ncbi:MAG: RDD family protein [Cytophagales bacterium]|jgi:uncharacterized RDD family membrane protein YckC|nr:RDD family protein [Cytophagales bacterium]
MQTNPTYTTPGAEPTNYADFGRRLVAAIIDGIIVSIPLYILMAVLGVGAASMMGGAAAGGDFSEADATAAAAGMMGTMFLVYIVFFVLVMAYYAYFESSEKQATLGKQVMGIKVVNMTGDRISFMNALGRAAAKTFLSGICLIGYIMALFTAKKQGLHDMIASTLVVTK